MVAIHSRLDDVLLTLKGKKVEATHKATISIPGVLREDGRAKRTELDVCEEGERELEKFKERMKKKCVELGDEMDRFSDTRRDARAAKPRQKPQQDAAQADKPVTPPPAQPAPAETDVPEGSFSG